MQYQDNRKKYVQLQKEYPFFIFENFEIKEDEHSVQIRYSFNLADRFHFYPSISIPWRTFFYRDILDSPGIKNIAFHIGMIELISYWKVACPMQVIIMAGYLDDRQKAWWKKLYYNGLGEFFYMNNLQPDPEEFMTIVSPGKAPHHLLSVPFTGRYIVPVGGGKDSAVTLELLKSESIIPFAINPPKAIVDSIKKSGLTLHDTVVINREIHPELLSLNDKGFLNGHTPFSALIAFTSLLASAITASRNIALSNESSSNEATIPGTDINHQYSKTFEFEKDFRWYVNQYISDQINYFSILRPLNELQIARRFADFPEYFDAFKSCNAGSKTDTWCGQCPKCLFSYIILSPFIEHDAMVKIFGKNMLDDKGLLDIFKQLTGIVHEKPFECVGTIDETNAALTHLINSHHGDPLPYLLQYYKTNRHITQDKNQKFGRLLNGFNPAHFLNTAEELRLKNWIGG
jgi:hypothetical protein